MKRLLSVILLACLLLTALPAQADKDYLGKMEVVNCNEWVSLREKPSTSAKRLAKVPLGAVVTECQQYSNSWIYARYEDWKGYIQTKYLRQLEGVSVYSAMLVTNCQDGTDFYLTKEEWAPDGFIPADTLVRDCAVYESGRAYVKVGSLGVYVNADAVVPYAELLHYPQRIMLHSNLYSPYEGPAPVLKIAYASDFPIKDYAYSNYESDEYMGPDGDVPKASFVLYADETINHVHLFSVMLASMDTDTGDAVYDATLENIQYQLDPEHPLLVGTVIWGDMPSLAVGYQDGTGAYHFAFVEISGEDGRLILREF